MDILTTARDCARAGNSQALGGVHMGAEGYRDVYVNDVGLAMLTRDGPYDFPKDTVIVKDQFTDKAAWEAGKGAAYTISLKVAIAFNQSDYVFSVPAYLKAN